MTTALAPEDETMSESDLPIIGVDPETFMLNGVDTDKGPLYTVSEMAKFFFARSNHWVRWLETQKKMILVLADDTQREIGNRRNDKAARIYTLSDMEEVAHALAQHRAISGEQLCLALAAVKAQAQMFNYLPFDYTAIIYTTGLLPGETEEDTLS